MARAPRVPKHLQYSTVRVPAKKGSTAWPLRVLIVTLNKSETYKVQSTRTSSEGGEIDPIRPDIKFPHLSFIL